VLSGYIVQVDGWRVHGLGQTAGQSEWDSIVLGVEHHRFDPLSGNLTGDAHGPFEGVVPGGGPAVAEQYQERLISGLRGPASDFKPGGQTFGQRRRPTGGQVTETSTGDFDAGGRLQGDVGG
jgi:hypothetical protein